MRSSIIAATVLIVSVGLAQAGIRADLSGDAVVNFATTMDMPLMTVGNPGNDGELSGFGVGTGAGGWGPDAIVGGVDYTYNIGKFEVTAGQYTEFLNAVAAEDTYGLYNPNMANLSISSTYGYGCNIQRSGSAGSYAYTVAADRADRPVNYVSWGDSARFSNWLTNGMPSGGQDASTTEDGSYDLSETQIYYGPGGAPPRWGTPELAALSAEFMAIARETDARYVIATEDEWYKAAYHKNDPGAPGEDYNDYPLVPNGTRSNDVETIDPGYNANYLIYIVVVGPGWARVDQDYSIGDPYWRTEVGEFENSQSPYGAFDMLGNIAERTEGLSVPAGYPSPYGAIRGGAFGPGTSEGRAGYRDLDRPLQEDCAIGFRIAEIPGAPTLLVDIKPGSDPNSVNLKSMGLLPVVVYGSEGLDLTEIDLDTLLLNGVGPRVKPNGSWHVSFEDVDGDLLLDLVMHFEMQALGIEPGMTELALTGVLMDGTELQGADAIRIVPDFNGDLTVNATDLAIMKHSYGAAAVGFDLGDANADGFVDATDLAILKPSFGFEAPTGAVPEPAFASMLLLGSGALLRKRRSSV